MGSRGSKQSQRLQTSSINNLDENNNSNSKLQLTSTLKMPIPTTFKCDQCGMVFSSDEALFKHRTRFCIGVSDSGIGRKVYYSDDEDMNGFTNRKVIKHQSPMDKKRGEINEWKNQRLILQSVQDMEDRILHDSQKTQRLANDLKKRTHDYNQILTEYERLQAEERDLLRQMFNLQGQTGSHLNHSNGLTEHERNKLENLQRQNLRLEQERRIIQNKLEDLIANNHQSSLTTNYEPYKLLSNMKEEQNRNETALMYLKRRLVYPDSLSDIPSLPYLNSHRRSTGDDVRYLQTGDHHSDLQRRLRNYEYYPWLKDYPEPLRRYQYHSLETNYDKLILAKNENQRLQQELDNIERKFQKLDSRTRQLELTVATSGMYDNKLPNYHSYPSLINDRYQPLRSLNNTSNHQIYSNNDNDLSDQQRQDYQRSLPALDKRITSHSIQSNNLINTNMRKLQDPLAPQPYDPIGGFVIFFDFIINLPMTIEQCRLITCLHHSQSGLGEPSQLQPFKCELYIDETNGEQMNVALIATKQPVPRCPAQQILSIVIELQISTKQTSNEILRTQAWTKLPLFDHRNRLLSGRWKVPLKTLPIQQDENLTIINTLPTFGRTELYYRLVNIQDAADQSNVPLSLTFRDLYFYPPQYRNRSYL